MILIIIQRITANVVRRILNRIRMQKYANFVIYTCAQNAEINKEHFLRKAVTYQSLSDLLNLKKRMMMKKKKVMEIYVKFAIENFILNKS